VQTVSRRLNVPEALAGKRLDQAAAELLPEFSRSRLKQWIDSGALTVDGHLGSGKQRVRGGEALALDAGLEAVVPAAPEAIPLDILYQDEALVVVDKPAGLVVHPGAGNPAGTLQNALLHFDSDLEAVPRAGLVHRLDKDTSGLLVVARNLSSQQQLAAMIERREIKRVYRAVCQTTLSGGGVIDVPIGRDPRDRRRMAVREGGRPARTYYRVKERFRAQTHIELELDTGRTHQIRVHMAHARTPLVGDPVYGGRPRLPRQPTALLRQTLQSFRRQALHAHRLSLAHPATGEPMEFQSELPEDFETLLMALRQDAGEAGR
jgi:23S rRNA pseudouridine1911/1915/1917 synthase